MPGDQVGVERSKQGDGEKMSIFSPGLDLYDLEKCQCDNCKKKEQEKNGTKDRDSET